MQEKKYAILVHRTMLGKKINIPEEPRLNITFISYKLVPTFWEDEIHVTLDVNSKIMVISDKDKNKELYNTILIDGIIYVFQGTDTFLRDKNVYLNFKIYR